MQSNRILFNYCKADLHEFKEILSHVPWNCIPTDNGIECAWQCWKNLFFSAATSVIPTVKWKRPKMKQWFTSVTLHLIRMKRHVYRQMKHFGSDLLKAKYIKLLVIWSAKRHSRSCN